MTPQDVRCKRFGKRFVPSRFSLELIAQFKQGPVDDVTAYSPDRYKFLGKMVKNKNIYYNVSSMRTGPS
jgi:hypothetical protein